MPLPSLLIPPSLPPCPSAALAPPQTSSFALQPSSSPAARSPPLPALPWPFSLSRRHPLPPQLPAGAQRPRRPPPPSRPALPSRHHCPGARQRECDKEHALLLLHHCSKTSLCSKLQLWQGRSFRPARRALRASRLHAERILQCPWWSFTANNRGRALQEPPWAFGEHKRGAATWTRLSADPSSVTERKTEEPERGEGGRGGGKERRGQGETNALCEAREHRERAETTHEH